MTIVIVIHLCDECVKTILPIVCHMPEFIFVTALASLLTDHRMSDLPIRAMCNKFEDNLRAYE